MHLPNGQNAIVDIRKIEEYCLNPEHPRGKHKAYVFERKLGITRKSSGILEKALQQAAIDGIATLGLNDHFGQRYSIEFDLQTDFGKARIMTAWIIKTGEDFPILTTCYII